MLRSYEEFLVKSSLLQIFYQNQVEQTTYERVVAVAK